MEFMDLQRPEYSYMFGFLQADGHLHRGPGRKGRLSVELTVGDKHILEQFQELCPYFSSIRERTRNTNFKEGATSAVWTMCSLEGRTKVNALGLPYGRKSGTIVPPAVAHRPRDYLRGLVDADGSVGFTGQCQPFISLTTSSEAIADYFVSHCQLLGSSVRRPSRNRRDNVYNVIYINEHAVSIARNLYPTNALALNRKAAKARAVQSWVRNDV
ncbi:LAGLIDADG family homing endonuclease [Yinghuangia seranimata]|uniref:LAGLIDADG family homing endonuclease n=1 Tax=Yinghuangia seranimata TaxID=408067 RepID=UPI00248B2A63|nr:LAGLIDADG family homing endonuclease [Yinghuangia seranimata]MDI2132510.1 LAGLIDADG family homing endonuclease [Yinghuangia seranimata]